ncbi:MAG: hypothetical protein K2X47_13275, partial [Bdellovibrionales bacterium]|nr:hypothetical protein [Bdellovibrionales bacterium]
LGALTDDQWKGGFVYQAESWEVNLIGHYGVTKIDNTPDSIETHLIAKVGGRSNLGSYNYFAYGVEYSAHPGRKDKGLDVSDSYAVGPYIALQRYFSGTNLMLNLWVNPFNYERSTDNDGSGGKTVSTINHFFQTGGFGVAYMF